MKRFILPVFLFFFFICIFPSPISAQIGWLWNWNQRKSIPITGSTAGVQTNYQVKVTVSFIAGKMKTDFSNIRFTSSDGATLIDHWRESYTTSSTADFWVEVPSISASPSTTAICLYYGNVSATSASNYFNTFDVLGNGSDGSLTVSAANTVINSYTYLTGDENAGDNVIAVNSGAAFSNGDDILIIRMKDASGSSAGTYEFRKISSGGGTNSFTLNLPLRNSYASVTQVVLIPQYSSVTVNSGGSITASAWDGNKGGIVIFRSSGAVSVAGGINVDNKGFLNGETYKGGTMYGGGGGGGGGAYQYASGTPGGIGGTSDGVNGVASANSGGFYGTSGGAGGVGGGANKGSGGNGGGTPGSNCGGGGGGGGGGGNFYGLGGLGGGKGGKGKCATGWGGFDGGTTSGINAGGADNGGGGNGGGGYGTNGTGGKGGDAAVNDGEDGTISGGGDGGSGGGPGDYAGNGGGGGAAGLSYGLADLSTIFLGTSGGNVIANTGAGGIIIAFANNLTITGTISSDGSNASGQIGGSSGGSVYLTGDSVTVGSSLVTTAGGTGVGTVGGGGAGGYGRIRLTGNSISGTSSPAAYTTGFDVEHNRQYISPEPSVGALEPEEFGGSFFKLFE